MKRIPLLLLALSLSGAGLAQRDSVTATYINSQIERIEFRLASDEVIKKDTTIYDEEEEGKTPGVLRLRVTMWMNPITKKIDKMVENSRYQQWTTNVEVYFIEERPVRITTTKWSSDKIILDFDVYYTADAAVHVTKRDNASGNPDCEFFLKWGYDLLSDARKLKPVNMALPVARQRRN